MLELIQLKTSKILPKICNYSWVVNKHRDLDKRVRVVCLGVCSCCISVSCCAIMFLYKLLLPSANIRQINSNQVISSLSLMFHKGCKRPHLYRCLFLTLLISRCLLQPLRQYGPFLTLNVMNCCISLLKPGLPFVTLRVRSDCKWGIFKKKKKARENYKP